MLTGAGSGIGKATALTLAAAGATVVGGDIDEAAVQATADEIAGRRRHGACGQRTDVTQRADVDALIDGAKAEFGRVDIMGNIAGVPHNKMVAECTDDEFERILAINLKSVFYGCQAAIRVMGHAGSGNIINISSGAIDTPGADARLLRHDEGRGRDAHQDARGEGGPLGIRVNALAPGVIQTNFSRHNFVDEDGNVVPEKVEQYTQALRRDGAARSGSARPRTSPTRSCSSSPSGAVFMTGQILRPNGGVAMPW